MRIQRQRYLLNAARRAVALIGNDRGWERCDNETGAECRGVRCHVPAHMAVCILEKAITKAEQIAAIILFLVVAIGTPAHARWWDTSKNPDLVPSLGWGAHAGKLPGYPSDFAKFTAFDADTRIPINNYLTLNLDVTQTTLQNVPLGISTDSYQFGVKLRVYLQDLK